MTPLLEVSGLSKTFYPTPPFLDVLRGRFQKKAVPVLLDLALTLHEGELYCLMGANGAGKTTLLKILCGLILPDTQRLRLCGEELPPGHPRLRASFGLVTGEEQSFYGRLTGRQNLEFFATFQGLPPKRIRESIEALCELFRMENYLDKPFFAYSTGMKQRLGLSRGLLGDPKILLLDEPTRSLDPAAAGEWHHFLRDILLEKEKKTVLYTTHSLEEAEHFSSRIGILCGGKIVAEGDLGTLKRKAHLSEEATLYDIFQKMTEGINCVSETPCPL